MEAVLPLADSVKVLWMWCVKVWRPYSLLFHKQNRQNVVLLMIADWCLKCQWTYVVISIPLAEREGYGSVSKLHDYILNYFVNKKYNIVLLTIADGCLKYLYLYSKCNGSFFSSCRYERERNDTVSKLHDYILQYYFIRKTDNIVFFMIADRCLKWQ